MQAITVFFDASCPLCRAEMAAIKSLDHQQEIALVDCSPFDFQASNYLDGNEEAEQRINRAAMMRLIHAKTLDGRWLIGVDVFVDLYRRIHVEGIAEFWSTRWFSPMLRALYPSIARHRQLLSKLGISRVYQWLVTRAQLRSAKLALARSSGCHDSYCERPNQDE